MTLSIIVILKIFLAKILIRKVSYPHIMLCTWSHCAVRSSKSVKHLTVVRTIAQASVVKSPTHIPVGVA